MVLSVLLRLVGDAPSRAIVYAAVVLVCSLPIPAMVIRGAAVGATYGMVRCDLYFSTVGGRAASRVRCGFRIVLGWLTLPLLPLSAALALL